MDNIKDILFSKEVQNAYTDKRQYQDHLLEQYKVFLDSTDRISSRRQTANSFFVSINTALIALIGYIQLGSTSTAKFFWLISLAGIAISYMWYRLIRSYKDLNAAKFKVIHEIEKKLPIRPYDAEWEYVGRGENSKLYLPFTHIEIMIPWIFILLHFITFLRSFPWEILKLSCNAS